DARAQLSLRDELQRQACDEGPRPRDAVQRVSRRGRGEPAVSLQVRGAEPGRSRSPRLARRVALEQLRGDRRVGGAPTVRYGQTRARVSRWPARAGDRPAAPLRGELVTRSRRGLAPVCGNPQSIQAIAEMSGSSGVSARQKTPPFV